MSNAADGHRPLPEAGLVITWEVEGEGIGICAWGDTVTAALRHLADCLIGGDHDGKPYLFVVHGVGPAVMDTLREIQVENPDL